MVIIFNTYLERKSNPQDIEIDVILMYSFIVRLIL